MESNPEKFVYRSQKKRYPWWVKSVEKITTEVDETIMEKPKKWVMHHLPRMDLEGLMNNVIKGRENYTKRIQNEEPGTRIQDAALHQGATSFWWAGFKMNNEEPAADIMSLINQARETMVVNPQDFGIDGWRGSPEEASRLIEAAGIFLGAAQVGFTRVNEKWLPPWVVFDPEADKVTVEEDRTQRYPERYKYVITGVCQAPVAAGIRSPSAIGAAGDRLGFEHAWLATARMIVFIQSLGYGAEYIPSLNPVPWAVASGLGEIGRMNRMISPLFGGSVRLYSIITDLPVALDKPIDFGLQEFCRHCKKCAEACPSGAVSMDKDPTWEWEGDQPWHYRGKKVWWEDSSKCMTYQTQERCINCVMSCPWTKDNKTVLHELAHIAAAKLPRLGGVFKKMDELFGYGLVKKTDGNMNDWWNYHDATNGFDSTRSRRG